MVPIGLCDTQLARALVRFSTISARLPPNVTRRRDELAIIGEELTKDLHVILVERLDRAKVSRER